MRVGATVGQFLMMGDLFDQQTAALFTGTGSQTTFSGAISAPVADGAQVFDQNGDLAGTFSNGVITGATGYLTSGTLDYATGSITLAFSTAPPSGDVVSIKFTQVAPYRVGWSAIGDPTDWPEYDTQAAIAAQSSLEDLQPDLQQVMFIAGYPLYALIFQRFGITRASYVGGVDVFDFAPYEFTHGVVAHGAAVQVNNAVFFLADDGFFMTDGANVYPIGTDQTNSIGIDNWFWSNVNMEALEAIRAGYDAEKRCVFFAIPTGTNVLPDTLLSFNPLANKWTRSAVACETIWSADNGTDAYPPTRQLLGVIDQTHTPNTLSGSPLTGYLESADLFFVDGMRRLTSGVRPNVSQTSGLDAETGQQLYTEFGQPLGGNPPTVTIGVRDALEDNINYDDGEEPDTFSRIAPNLQEGMYTRCRVTSDSATALKGATLYLEVLGPL